MNPSLFSFIADASIVVKFVMLILLLASVASWTIIVQRFMLFRRAKQMANQFENQFWSGTDLNTLSQQLQNNPEASSGLARIFLTGFNEYQRLKQQPNIAPLAVMQGTERAMRIAKSREIESLENHLAFLATVGSTSPYIGLFGTVWGIMTSFSALSHVQQATLAAVAPGISEALIATAIGLFAAIPAVIAYNRYVNQLARIEQQFDNFQEEFSNILHRQTHSLSGAVA
ncbi:MAG: protein TolQ [Gammaproteobacteria bacterium]|nr:protein TolQ [Gammaproteobacteria bacterium]